MRSRVATFVVVSILAGTAACLPAADSAAAAEALTAADLAGAWAGTVSHDGESVMVGLELEPGDDGKVLLKLSSPVVHIAHAPLGRVPLVVEGDSVRLGPFAFRYDRAAGTLTGLVPDSLAPVYKLPITLRRVPSLDLPLRPEPRARLATPSWIAEIGAPLWPGTTLWHGVVYAGAEDGRMHALDAGTGHERWTFAAGGPIRTRAVVSGDALYFQADDGVLYALAADTGRERWRLRVTEKAILRRPPSDPGSRFDRFGSDVAVAHGRLFLGTHDGRLLCLDPAGGREVWRFESGDSVLAAPAVEGGRVYFGSFDGHVYALDEKAGTLVWKYDTGKPVVSTPVLAREHVIVGSRSYDLLALDARTGALAWKRYIWFSWVESSPVLRDGIVYVGSSDAAALFAFESATGRPVWQTDVWGWAWGQPAVTARRVYMGTSALDGYPVPHQAGLLAVDRATGEPVWRFLAPVEKDKAYGFTGSVAVGAGHVFAAGLDGRVVALPE